MFSKTEDFQFYYVYEKAALVEECVYEGWHFMEMGWGSPNVLQCLQTFSKVTLLHHYIYAVIAVETRRHYGKNSDMFEEDDIQQIEDIFDVYDIEIEAFKSFATRNNIDLDECDFPRVFYSWFTEQEERFEELWAVVTDEVFYLLFANRNFLMAFNEGIAEYLSSGEVNIPANYLSNSGKLNRQSYIPTWARKAIYFRDHGRCVLCQKDLSGLLSTDRQIHYDHMVALHQWGTNDPCNLQLLCDDCNLRKSGNAAETSTRYPPWWSHDDGE
jgi:hypothetical protein